MLVWRGGKYCGVFQFHLNLLFSNLLCTAVMLSLNAVCGESLNVSSQICRLTVFFFSIK